MSFSPMASGFLSGKYTASMTYVGELAEVEEALSHIVIHGNRTDEDIQRMGYVKPQ